VKREMDRDTLINVAKTSLRTKVHSKLADVLTEVGTLLLLWAAYP
jgi:T-complex protein 1 subunit zeta